MALPESSSKEERSSKTGDHEDKDFDPTPEALIDEIDDERTLEEEEALDGNNGAAVQEELDDLKKESEMSIEELLAYYERMRNETQGNSDDEEEEEDEDDDEDEDEEDEGENEGPGEKNDKNDRDDRGKGPESQPEPNRPSADSTSQQHQTKNNEPNHDPSNCKPSQTSSNQKQNRCSSSNYEILNSDVHSTANNPAAQQLSETATTDSAAAQRTAMASNQTVVEHNQLACNAIDSFNVADVTLAKHRHYLIEDGAGGMFEALLRYELDSDDSDDMDEDYSYTDDENGDDERDWRRVIHVGPDYQADVPDGLCEYDDLPPYENEDKLVWKCSSKLTQDEVHDYLKRVSALSKRTDTSTSPASVPKISYDSMRSYRERMQDITSSKGSHTIEHNHEQLPESLPDVYMSQSRKRARIDYELEQENAMDGINHTSGVDRDQILINSKEDNSDSTSIDARPECSTEEYFQDEEQLLLLLLQCNYNFDEALRRRKLDPFKYYLYEPMSLWSQEECLGFEHGLRIYGKDFRSIRENKVQTRTHAEVVAFYYLWKKSERHDVYTNQYKLDRKRCLSHPGTTDYMDKFIEDNESALNASSSSTSTPTDSLGVGVNLNVEIASNDTSSLQLCQTSDNKPTSIQCIRPPQPNIQQRQHLQLHQPQKDDEDGQNNPVMIDSNTPL